MSRKQPFPRQIARFMHLEGGLYGTLDLVALTRETLELQLGADFVQFTREQAEDLRDAVQRFLELDADGDIDRKATDDVVAADVVVEERDEARGRRRRRSREPA